MLWKFVSGHIYIHLEQILKSLFSSACTHEALNEWVNHFQLLKVLNFVCGWYFSFMRTFIEVIEYSPTFVYSSQIDINTGMKNVWIKSWQEKLNTLFL
jgi:hypothetical protein